MDAGMFAMELIEIQESFDKVEVLINIMDSNS
jgi:hypothetical protein